MATDPALIYYRENDRDSRGAMTEQEIYEVLRECYDPEIPVNIVDLGLVYGVSVSEGVVNVQLTLTAPGCHLSGMITQDIQDKLLGIPGCQDAEVEIVWDPPWTPHMMSDAAKKKLGID
jgi:metal-sulfur cluster biosynthetic enzyme